MPQLALLANLYYIDTINLDALASHDQLLKAKFSRLFRVSRQYTIYHILNVYTKAFRSTDIPWAMKYAA